jgi:hypothetical protein
VFELHYHPGVIQMTIAVLVYFAGAAYLLGIATAVSFFALMLRGADGAESNGCFMQSVILVLVLIAAYLIYAGMMLLA